MNQPNRTNIPRMGYTPERKKRIVFFRKLFVAFCALVLLTLVVLGIIGIVKLATHVPGQPEETKPEETNAPATEPPATDEQTEPETLPPETVPPETEPPAEQNGIVVVLDPGHGHYDPGTSSDYLYPPYKEMDITLDIGLRLRDLLTYRGYTVIMTHEDNVIPSDNPKYILTPNERAAFCRAQPRLDVFVSIHCNAFTTESVHGTQIFYYKSNYENVRSLLSRLGPAITEKTGNSVTPMEGDYAVIRTTTFPAILIETDFVTNEEAAEKMKTEEWRQAMAEGIADGICAAYPAQ